MRNSLDTITTRPKTTGTSQRTRCKACAKIIYRIFVGCTECVDTWFHLRYAGFPSKKVVRDRGKYYQGLLKEREIQLPNMGKIIGGLLTFFDLEEKL